MSASHDQTLAGLRAQIADADRAILAAVNRRVAVVSEVRTHKRRHGIAFLDPDRERQLVAELVAENPGPLSDDGVRELFARILELVKHETERER